ncbi:transcriptional regulator [Nonomuraea purpurea]|uniref:Transcriptional regulator n=1 Tax=Nonomuraea purpurea TaxID=1849276 RepID=A0ABV8G0E8_9ACTN
MDLLTTWTGSSAAALRQAFRYTQIEFARHLGVAPRTIANWDTTPTLVPGTNQQRILDTALRMAPGEVQARFRLLNSTAGISAPSFVPAPRDQELDDMNRRELLRLFSMAGVAIAAPPWDDELDVQRVLHAGRTGRVDHAGVDQFEVLNSHLWRVFVLAPSKAKIYPLVQDHLAVLVRTLQHPNGPEFRQRLCALTADLFQLAGEIFFDGDQYTDAAHCYTLAATAGKEADAFDLWACAMTRHAYIGVYERRFDKAEPMLDLALRLARRGDSSLCTRHWIAAVQAETWAGLGNLNACQQALDQAELVRDLKGPVHNGGWLRFDGDRLAEERGTCYVTLRRPDLAERVLTEALAQELSERRRGGVLIDLAALGLQRGNRDQVVSYGDRAVELARQTGSKFIARRLRGLQDQMKPILGDQRVGVLNANISSLITSAA